VAELLAVGDFSPPTGGFWRDGQRHDWAGVLERVCNLRVCVCVTCVCVCV